MSRPELTPMRPREPAPPPDAPNGTAVYLHPGQMHAAIGPCSIKTLLGSCVAVCIWDPVGPVGGMVHYLLPTGIPSEAEKGRYGNLAIPALIRAIRALGGRQGGMSARVFGGGSVVPALASRAASLGDSNVRIARELLAAQRIPIMTSDVGGTSGRRILFHVHDGSTWVWKLSEP